MGEGEGRVFLRGISSETYGLGEFRRRQRQADRIRRAGTVVDDATVGHSGDSDRSHTSWMLGPGDDPFLTQTLQVHFVELEPGSANHGHGHQNEACFYILEGRGYEIHDGQRYDWEKDDFVIVHTDCVHKHYNADPDNRALALVMKTKCTWMHLGLWQQGRSAPFEDAGYGPREDWSQLWTSGAPARSKVVRSADTRWEDTRDGHVRIISAPDRTNVRTNSVDVYQQAIPPGGRSAKHWHMADEVVYVMSGRGHSLHWDVEAEIAEKYYARVATAPSRWEFASGDVLYIPQNTVHQHFNDDPADPLVFLSAQNRVFKHLGYDAVVYLEDASAKAAEPNSAASAPKRA